VAEQSAISADDRAKFRDALGFDLPKQLGSTPPYPPHLEHDVDTLIRINTDIRAPGTPWIGDEGLPWPDEHVVIGEDQTGNYYSMLRPGSKPASGAVWFLDHEVDTLTKQYSSVKRFHKELDELFAPPPSDAPIEWRVFGQTALGPIKFGMTPQQVRAAAREPWTSMRLSPTDADDTDIFESLQLHVTYEAGKCVMMECFNPGFIAIGGHRLDSENFYILGLIFSGDRDATVAATQISAWSQGAVMRCDAPDPTSDDAMATNLRVMNRERYEREFGPPKPW
jgi:hypothetical protein